MKKRWILLAISIFLSTEGLCRESVYIHNGFISGNEFLSITNVVLIAAFLVEAERFSLQKRAR